MKTKVDIRRATETDLDTIEILQTKLFEFDTGYDSTLDLEWSASSEAKSIRGERINGKGLLLVAEVEDQLVGYLMAVKVDADSFRKPMAIAEAEEFFILDAWRNRGIGEAMWAQFELWAIRTGCDRLSVSVSAANARAIQFYKTRNMESVVMVMESALRSPSDSIP